MHRHVAGVRRFAVSQAFALRNGRASTFMHGRDPGPTRGPSDLQSAAFPAELSQRGRRRAKSDNLLKQEGAARSDCFILSNLCRVPHPRNTTTPGVQHWLSLPQRTSGPIADEVIGGPLRGVPSAVRVLCRHRLSRTPWSSESVSRRRASHTTRYLSGSHPSSLMFWKKAALHHAGIEAWSRRRQRCIVQLKH